MRVARSVYQRLYALASAKLGRCPYCMGLALSGAVIGWVVLGGVVLLWPQFPFTNLLALWPASFTVLWVLHILTYGGRVVAAEHRAQQEAIPATGPVMTRRRMVGILAGSAVVAAVVSVWSAVAAAQGKHCCTLPGFSGSCGTCGANLRCVQATDSSNCWFTIACNPTGHVGRGICMKG